MSSKAYLEARAVVDAPYTEREERLVEALQAALDDHVHDECRERLKDAVDELAKADASRLREAPEAEVNLFKAKRLVEDRRHGEPTYNVEHGGRYDQMLKDREVTDLLEQLLDEVEAYRKLAGVTS